ncbi:hypothetical protein VAPA_1c17990 [Variovorax paradoxus B4]|uniref:Uncharacterized protein n=1 Tax=Variovorax paradoxus B4 TaxID=1246301 RepID=T1X7J2_VARPD|nr:hypothetical protein VAPA_1c17990 [Variovorax paradoxus B4]
MTRSLQPHCVATFLEVCRPWLQAIETPLISICTTSIKQRVHPENSLLNQNHSAE